MHAETIYIYYIYSEGPDVLIYIEYIGLGLGRRGRGCRPHGELAGGTCQRGAGVVLYFTLI